MDGTGSVNTVLLSEFKTQYYVIPTSTSLIAVAGGFDSRAPFDSWATRSKYCVGAMDWTWLEYGYYAIGDVHGCYDALQKLLQHIDYRPDRDRLIFIGDLVNTGPDSLKVLRFIAALKNVKASLVIMILCYWHRAFKRYPNSKKF